MAVARKAGAAGWGAYIGGHTFAPPWPEEGVRALLAAGLGILPIYAATQGDALSAGLGAAEAADAVRLMRAYGFPAGSIVVVDIEAGTFSANPASTAQYAEAWCAGVRTAGYSPGVYGTCETCAACSGSADFIWVASYVASGLLPAADPARIPGLADGFFAGPGRRAWQYANSFEIAGVQVDASCSNLPLVGASGGKGQPGTPEDDMTPEQEAKLDTIIAWISGTGNASFNILKTGNPRDNGSAQPPDASTLRYLLSQNDGNTQPRLASLMQLIGTVQALNAKVDALAARLDALAPKS